MRGSSTSWAQLLRWPRLIILTATVTAVSPPISSEWALKADAAVLTKFGGGVPHADLAETARLLEGMDIKTAVQVTDLARDRRVESALLFNFPEVNAIVCIGGNSTTWEAPRLERVIAANPEMVERLRGPFELEAMSVIGVSNQQGISRLRSMIY